MILIWGRKLRTELKGVVADRCLLCRKISKGSIEELSIVDHLFFVALAPGELLETRFRCHGCGGTMRVASKDFDVLLLKNVAKSLETDDVMRRTNARLTSEVVELAEIEIAAHKWLDGDRSGDDPRVDLIRLKLRAADDDEDAATLRALLERWPSQDEETRQQALHTAEQLRRRAEYNRSVEAFVHWAAQQFTPRYDVGWFIALACLLVLIGLVIVPRKGIDDVSVWMVFGGSSFVAGCLYLPLHRYLHRRFFRTVFVPQASQRSIDPQHALAWLRWYRSTPDPPKNDDSPHLEALRGMAKASDLLAEAIEERELSGSRVEASME